MYPGRVSFAHAAQRDIHKGFSDDRATFKTTPFVDVPISPPGQSSSLLDNISLDTAGGGMSTLHPFVCFTTPICPLFPPFSFLALSPQSMIIPHVDQIFQPK